MAVSQLGWRGVKPFTVQAMILRFIRNYQLLNEKPSNNHRVGGEGDYIGLWKCSTAGYADVPRDIRISALTEGAFFLLLSLLFFITACPCMNALFVLYKHRMYKYALTWARKGSCACYTWKNLVHLQGWKLANGCCDTLSEVKVLFKRVFFGNTEKYINMGDRNLLLHFFRQDFYFFLSCSVAIAITFTQNSKLYLFLIKTLTVAIILIISKTYYIQKTWSIT